MAENVLRLKKRAVAAGMDKADAKRADRAKLEAFLAENSGGATATVAKKKKGATVAKKKAGRKPVKRQAAKSAPAAKKSGKGSGKAKRPTAKQAAKNGNGDLGRLNIGEIDFNAEGDWNPREGSGTYLLFRALKSSRGNVDKALGKLEGNVFDFVGKKMRDGSKRSKSSALEMLRYRLNRTRFDFAKATGQHESADAKNRAAYGTGQYATVRKVKPPRKNAASKTKTTKGGTKVPKSTKRKTSKKR